MVAPARHAVPTTAPIVSSPLAARARAAALDRSAGALAAASVAMIMDASSGPCARAMARAGRNCCGSAASAVDSWPASIAAATRRIPRAMVASYGATAAAGKHKAAHGIIVSSRRSQRAAQTSRDAPAPPAACRNLQKQCKPECFTCTVQPESASNSPGPHRLHRDCSIHRAAGQ